MELIYDESQIHEVARSILSRLTANTVLINGVMGAGKTTLVKALVRELGSADTVNSPTFGLVNEYYNSQNELVAYHFDFYRIQEESEVLDLGFDMYLNAGVPLFIEWSERIPNLIPEKHHKIELLVENVSLRQVKF
ncbi:MAG: tRNA (adenosine(37)-N6)-threonylcarbamoyltransferase complex ATPase subunit type 1 TsaE [Bacteroidota bacterium]